jgi:hypothetical protein
VYKTKTNGGVKKTYPAFGIYRCGPERYSPYLSEFKEHSWYLLENHPAYQ